MGYENIYRVIVAEDEQLILNSIVRKINSVNVGFKVIGAAEDGKKALELIDQLSPDILVTDIRMPVMDGLELIKTVNSRYPHIIKVVLSGYNEFEYAQQAMKYEVKDYLLKPLKKEVLIETLNRIRISLNAQKNLIEQNLFKLKDNHTYSAEEVARMVEYFIKENYVNEINLDLIARNFNYHSSYLSKIFTKYTGENPSKYIITLRINKARHLLLNEKGLSIKEVGEMVGYPNQYHFSHVFKMMTGKSPAAFRDESDSKV